MCNNVIPGEETSDQNGDSNDQGGSSDGPQFVQLAMIGGAVAVVGLIGGIAFCIIQAAGSGSAAASAPRLVAFKEEPDQPGKGARSHSHSKTRKESRTRKGSKVKKESRAASAVSAAETESAASTVLTRMKL